MDASMALPAPQAALMTQIASGIVHGELPWNMVLTGMGLGAASSPWRRGCAEAGACSRPSRWESASIFR